MCTVFDWMSAFKAKNVKRGKNEVLVICHNKIEEQEKSETFCKNQNAKFTFESLPTMNEGYDVFEDIWIKNLSTVIFAICEDNNCQPCLIAKDLERHLRDQSIILSCKPWLTLLSAEDVHMYSQGEPKDAMDAHGKMIENRYTEAPSDLWFTK